MAEKMGTAVVTGASSGIVARNAERLERIARSIREQTGQPSRPSLPT
ncbi:hypothetical protein FB009_114119 [Sinorhizobium medicae]|nr:hypothetical protein FB009_114119 [Sinorhizobium medicae]